MAEEEKKELTEKKKPEQKLTQKKTTKAPQKEAKTAIYVLVGILILLLLYYMISGISLMKQGKLLKTSIRETATYAKEMNIPFAKTSWETALDTDMKMSVKLSNPLWRFASHLPLIGKDIKSARLLTGMLASASDGIVEPGLDALDKYPLDNLKAGDGFNASAIRAYLDVLSAGVDFAETYGSSLNDLSFRFVKVGIEKYKDKIDSFMDLCSENGTDIKMFRAMFGDDGDNKLYIIAAQNSAEIRASGGFPGSIGTLKIEDGVMLIGGFKPINEVIAFNNPSSVWATSEDRELFSWWIDYPRDQCYNPNFESVGHNWCVSYEAKTGDKADGVISMTPSIIQKILNLINCTIELSDGTELDGRNATKVLQYDLYFDYFNSYRQWFEANDAVDALFEETAGETMRLFEENFNIGLLPGCLDMYNEGVEDRTIMFWFEDEGVEKLAKNAGCSGSIGPGVFFSMSTSSKLGWFFDMDTKVNNLGNDKYRITVTLGNSITYKEINGSAVYVVGETRGVINGYLHLFAPKNGKISDVKSSDGTNFKNSKYCGLDVSYTHNITLTPGEEITVTYVITSKEPFELLTTPTLKYYK